MFYFIIAESIYIYNIVESHFFNSQFLVCSKQGNSYKNIYIEESMAKQYTLDEIKAEAPLRHPLKKITLTSIQCNIWAFLFKKMSRVLPSTKITAKQKIQFINAFVKKYNSSM